ncbi:hypothetical protein Ga0074812_102109 [Parafrankia irregularis]|uniref:Uncharacterized protein n=1 Tax=Parafrankia irregularis TaxID=795642 RepID=A0A0S4QHX2_9ACTN|nr:hypothetical protein Ga0074812_102109 [Parafrankia irregularis]
MSELGHRCRPGVLSGSSVFVDQAAEDRPTFDPFLGQFHDGVVRPWWLKAPTAVGSSSVVVPCVLGHDGAQVPFAEDQHPIGDLDPDIADEPFAGVTRRAASMSSRRVAV